MLNRKISFSSPLAQNFTWQPKIQKSGLVGVSLFHYVSACVCLRCVRVCVCVCVCVCVFLLLYFVFVKIIINPRYSSKFADALIFFLHTKLCLRFQCSCNVFINVFYLVFYFYFIVYN